VVSDADRERLAQRQATAAVALWRLGRSAAVWPLLAFRPDPRLRSYLLHRLKSLGADPAALAEQVPAAQEVSIRRAWLLAVGEFGPEKFSPAERARLAAGVGRLFRDDPDPGVHGAAAWCLRRWGRPKQLLEFEQSWVGEQHQQNRRRRLAAIRYALAEAPARPQWYVNGEGQTLVVIPAQAPFWMGSPPTEAVRTGGPGDRTEQRHLVRIGRTFAIAAHKVTVAQFLAFRKNHEYMKPYSPAGDYPVNLVNWYDAVAYCNWLSKKEGIPPEEWCYRPNKKGAYAEGMTLAPDYLKRTGYRLPSEAEREYACRAGTVTSRYYGETEALLGEYAWYTKNSQNKGMLPVGKMKPNDLGLFDMLGNAMEWCQDPVFYYVPGKWGQAREDREYNRDIYNGQGRVLRGSAFHFIAEYVSSAHRGWYRPAVRSDYFSFRVARTFR
jgi:formylglycine-generating enzyme required for sulfatase activity